MAAVGQRPCQSRTPDRRCGGPRWAAALLALFAAAAAPSDFGDPVAEVPAIPGGPVPGPRPFLAELPGIGLDDRRTRVEPNGMPWAALARLQVAGESRCTAFLVAPRMAVTAAHCLYSRRLGRFVQAGAVHVLLGYNKGSFTQHVAAASFRIAPGYDPEAGADAGALDFAVVHFARPLAPVGRTLELLDVIPPLGTKLSLGGYGQDRAEVLLADTDCSLRGIAGSGAAALMVHDCEGTRGVSGAPLLVLDPILGWRVAGVQTTGYLSRAGGTAVPASAVQALLGR